MARFFFWLVVLPVAAGIIVFAIVNRQAVDVSLWPAPYAMSLPAWALIVAGVALGIVIGGVTAWSGGSRQRADGRAQRCRADGLERDLLLEKEKTTRLEKMGTPPARGGQGDGLLPAPAPRDRG